MSAPQKQISETPLVSKMPRRRGQNLLMLVILSCMVAVVTGITLYWLDANQRRPDPHTTQWPRDIPPDTQTNRDASHEEALKHMQTLATALLRYRDGPDGGGIRWPDNLEVLQMAGLLEQDWDPTGVLSQRPVAYQPEMPIGHDPERWVICHDIEYGRRRNAQTGYSTLGPRAAAVILADGTAKLIKDEELETYGGLTFPAGAGR